MVVGINARPVGAVMKRRCVNCMALTSSGSRCASCEAAYLGAIQARKNAEFGGSGGRWQTIRREVYARQEGRCAKCGNELGTSFEVDHVRPRALGGQSVPENLQALCPKPCHLEKSTADRVKWSKRKALVR